METPTTSPDLQQTIAEAREAQAAEQRERIAELEHQVQHYQDLANERGKELEEMHLAITELEAKKIALKSEETVKDTSEHATHFFDVVERHLATHGKGAQAILAEIERRGPVEQATYIASIDRIAEAMQQNTVNLYDLASRSRTAQELARMS